MNKAKSYRDLEVFVLAKKLAIETHKISLALPKYELYEEGSQIRRSSKSVVSNLVEGFARKNYKNEFLRYITYCIGECDETQVHLEMLFETGSLKNEKQFEYLSKEYNKLARMLNRFYSSVLKMHISPK